MAKHMVLTYLHFRILKISHWKFPKKAAAKSQRSQLGPQVEPLELPPEATERQHLEMMARQSPGTDDGPWIFGGFSHGIFPRKSGQFMGNYMGVYVSNLWQTQVFVREIFSVCFFWGVRDTIFLPFKSSYIGAMSAQPFIAKIIFTIIPVLDVLGQKHKKKVETSSISFI